MLHQAHALLVPGANHACGFTFLHHPLLCTLLDYVWVPQESSHTEIIHHGWKCVFVLHFLVCHCRHNNAMKIPSVSLEQTKEKCVSYVLNPVADQRKFQRYLGLSVIICSSGIPSRVFQDYFGVPQSGQDYES